MMICVGAWAMSKHFLYTLVFDCDPEPVVFYVGHTKDPKRREAEHRIAARDVRNTEYKYQWCRELAAVDTAWDFVVVGEIEDDEDSEYAWILKFARRNQDLGLSFIDGLPLTNMKAGDFLDEILADRTIRTADDIKAYRQRRIEESKPTGLYKRSELDYFNPTPRPLTERAQILADWMRESAPCEFQDFEAEKKRQKEEEYEKMINDPERIERIKAETLRLMAEEDK
jgi:hypothetical protein